MSARRALVCGASVAGPALAHWLWRYGWDVEVVERAPQLRTGGQNIDIRGAARRAVEGMGLTEAVRAATTGERGTRFLDRHGAVVAAFPAGTTSSGGATGEVEILRGDLAALLVEATPAVPYRYGDHVTAVLRNADDVRVRFARGTEETYDVVVAADGVRSSTRDLVFGDEVAFRSLQLQISYGTIERRADDVDWWRWYNAPGGRSVTLRPDRHGTTRATLSVVGPRAAEGADLDPAERLAWLEDVFADAGWQARRVLDGFATADDLYSEAVGQIRAPRWSAGRVGLVGDAAWCASPISGMGTSLALVGAYVLAGELTAHVHPRDGFAGFETTLRPYVQRAQQLPPGTPQVANPQTRAGIAVLHGVLRAAASRPARAASERLFAPPADTLTLPDYAHLLTR